MSALREDIDAILALGISHNYIAKQVGISQPTFDRWYNDHKPLKVETMLKIQNYVNWFKNYVKRFA